MPLATATGAGRQESQLGLPTRLAAQLRAYAQRSGIIDERPEP